MNYYFIFFLGKVFLIRPEWNISKWGQPWRIAQACDWKSDRLWIRLSLEETKTNIFISSFSCRGKARRWFLRFNTQCLRMRRSKSVLTLRNVKLKRIFFFMPLGICYVCTMENIFHFLKLNAKLRHIVINNNKFCLNKVKLIL